jgi:hypothetical protein
MRNQINLVLLFVVFVSSLSYAVTLDVAKKNEILKDDEKSLKHEKAPAALDPRLNKMLSISKDVNAKHTEKALKNTTEKSEKDESSTMGSYYLVAKII